MQKAIAKERGYVHYSAYHVLELVKQGTLDGLDLFQAFMNLDRYNKDFKRDWWHFNIHPAVQEARRYVCMTQGGSLLMEDTRMVSERLAVVDLAMTQWMKDCCYEAH